MKITILNGCPDPREYALEGYLAHLSSLLTGMQHEVTLLNLRELDIRYCIGCFGCWVKTPGECVSRDESCQVCQAIINSDFTLWASPLRMGFPTALLKKAMDKSIPLIHPYVLVDHAEAHHRPRYAHYPRLGLLLEKEPTTGAADLEIVADIFARTALNMKSSLEFSLTSDQPAEVIAQAITARKQPGVRYKRGLAAIPGVQIPAPTRLTIFNGSPRGQKGNTPILFNQFLNGFTSLEGRSYEIFHLNHLRQAETFPQAFEQAECVLLGFPLYTDAMPGLVKTFIEQLEPFVGRPGNPPIGFLVQSGFPEAAHSRHVERYLEKLAARLGSPYLGTIVKGGVEGTQMMSADAIRDRYAPLYELGQSFARTGQLDPLLLQTLAKPEQFPAYLAPLFQLFLRLPSASSYWDSQLKENGVFEQRFARPYIKR